MSLDNTPEQSQLGRTSTYVDRYDPGLLFPIPRATQRQAMGIATRPLPVFGADLWTAFELSWLNPRGKPQLAIVHFTVPCETPNIIESKSFKLYLNSFNSTVFVDAEAVRERLRADLSEAVWRGSERAEGIGVKLVGSETFDREQIHELPASAEGGKGHPAADDLAERHEVGQVGGRDECAGAVILFADRER